MANRKPAVEPAKPVMCNEEDLVSSLCRVADAQMLDWPDDYAFSLVFARMFLSSMPEEASRSNWTHRISTVIEQAAGAMGWRCDFEALGRLDAIIQTWDEPRATVLAAEWEWEGETVFGKGMEMEKLLLACRRHPEASALLVTYCPEQTYLDYIGRVVDYWVKGTARKKTPQALHVHTLVYEIDRGGRYISGLSSVVVGPNGVEVWPILRT